MAICFQCGKKFNIHGSHVCQACSNKYVYKPIHLNVNIPHVQKPKKRANKRDLLIAKYKKHLDSLSDEDISKILQRIEKYNSI